MAAIPPCPMSLRQIQPYLKLGEEYQSKDRIICYWSRLYALRLGVKCSRRATIEANFLYALMSWLKTYKRQNNSNEGITTDAIAKAHIQNYIDQMYTYATEQCLACNLEKSVVKAFWTSGFLYDVLQIFGELPSDSAYTSEYAKVKAAFLHKRMKIVDVPLVNANGEEIVLLPNPNTRMIRYRAKTTENPPCPISLRRIHHYLKIGQEHDMRDVVVSYWAHLYALQVGVNISQRQPDEAKFLFALMNWLKLTKKENLHNDGITTEAAAKAHVEEYTRRMFLFANKQYRQGNFGKGTIKAFWTSGYLFDIMQIFGKLSTDGLRNGAYAKTKAAYIYKTLKNGGVPVIDPLPGEGSDSSGDDDGEEDGSNYRLSLKFILIK